MLFVVQGFACHNSFWADGVRNTTFHRKVIEQLDAVENKINHQEFGYSVERKAVGCRSASFLDDSDTAFDFRYVFVSASEVDLGSTRLGVDQCLQRREFTSGVHHGDLESMK